MDDDQPRLFEVKDLNEVSVVVNYAIMFTRTYADPVTTNIKVYTNRATRIPRSKVFVRPNASK